MSETWRSLCTDAGVGQADSLHGLPLGNLHRQRVGSQRMLYIDRGGDRVRGDGLGCMYV